MEKIYKVGKQGKLLRVRLQILVVTWKNGKWLGKIIPCLNVILHNVGIYLYHWKNSNPFIFYSSFQRECGLSPKIILFTIIWYYWVSFCTLKLNSIQLAHSLIIQVLHLFSKNYQFKSHKLQGYWIFTWLLISGLVELNDVRVRWFGHPR
jgi:hypothetical protein